MSTSRLATEREDGRRVENPDKRLVDVLDLHGYTEVYANGQRITGDDNSPESVAARVQAPRSLWDDSFQEDSWIAGDVLQGPVPLIPWLKERIDEHYPGTGLGFTEYNYGGGGHISGAIAQADILGIFGREGVTMAAYWALTDQTSESFSSPSSSTISSKIAPTACGSAARRCGTRSSISRSRRRRWVTPPITGSLWIEDVVCEPGLLDPTMTICRYQFLTDFVTANGTIFPEHSRYPGWYHTCPDQNEQGALTNSQKYHSVLSPNVTLGSNMTGPEIAVDAGMFINGCLNGAVSKGQYRLNAFYDSTAYRGLDATQRTAMLRMWMAWHDGATQTIPGQLISPHDPIQGLFTWTTASGWDLEGGYDAAGASCRGGGTNGLHRYVVAPVLNLVGWSSLTTCNTSNIGTHAKIGVKVPI